MADAKEKVAQLREREEEESEDYGYDPEELGPSYDVPDYDVEEDPSVWHGFMPPTEKGGAAVYIEGVLPNTQLTRQAMEAVPKKTRRDPLIGLKEAQENLIRLCIRKIGKDELSFSLLRGRGLDRYLSAKQMHFVTEYFDRLTTPDDTDVESFLATCRTGKRKS